MQNFVHLRIHSEFSVTDGIIHVKDLIKHAVDDGMLSLALTDLNNMFALVKFYKNCRDKGIKPIIGSEINVIDNESQGYKLVVLAKNINGYKTLSDLITRSYIENRILDVPYVKEEWLLNQTQNNDLIILSGFSQGDVGQLLLQNNEAKAIEKSLLWQKAFGDNYYYELHRINSDISNQLIPQFVKLSQELNIALVASHPVQFLKSSDYEAHEVRVCVANSQQLDDAKRVSSFLPSQYFKTQAEMIELFKDIPSAISNTIEIAKRCNVEITLGKYFLPDFETENNMPIDEYLSYLANAGLDKRLQEIYSSSVEIEKNREMYAKRLDIEIQTITQMGFSGYFLIVADFINWAKENNVPVGPGRGSGAGSLVAFALGITDIEPLRYGLLFERFLNPERVSMPDFDIDFCQEKRELVIRYVQQKYGANAVSQIATFGTMSSKAVIKDVGRVLGLPYGLCDAISKMILNTPAKSFALLEAYDVFPDLKERIDQADDELRRLWELSLQLEDMARNVGKHAAGVLIAPTKLTDFCPLYFADGMQTSQLDKDDVEAVGLVKFDFLGLRNLTIIQEAVENVKTLLNKEIVLTKYDFTDKETYKLLQAGNTAAIFQLESKGMRRVLTKLEPDKFEEIIALLALYRPGPLGSGMVDDFVKRKKGEQEADYFHPDLEECLKPTYGVIVYQEQVMQISQIIGGYTLGGADLLRRAMGKKKPEEMKLHRNMFVEGALKKGYERSLAENLFDLMSKFAEYGFNKSHSAAYAVISYHTAYLKAHYKTCFMAATLSSELDNTDKLFEFYEDCLDNDIEMLAPDINMSAYRFKPINETTIRYALGAIKGVGQSASEMIVQEREENGEYLGFVDFCRRCFKTMVNRKTIENLIKAGAFDSVDTNRSKLLNNLSSVLDQVEIERENANQGSLFDVFANDGDIPLAPNHISLTEYPIWSDKEKLTNEKQSIGFYFSGSLFDEYHDIVRKFDLIKELSSFNLENDDMQEVVNSRSREKMNVLVGGVINYMGSRPLKKGGKMVFVNIEDKSGELEFVAFDEEFNKYKSLLKEDELVFIEGELMYDSFRQQIKVTAKQIYTIDQLIEQLLTNITLTIDHSFDLEWFNQFLVTENGAKIKFNYNNQDAKCRLKLNNKFLMKNYETLKAINTVLGKHNWA